MSDWTLTAEEVIAWAAAYVGEPFHALLADPPYHLTTITKRFGEPDSVPAQFGRDGAFSRLSRGFMGQTWDGGDLAFRPETWRALGKLLYPGAFGMAYGGSRTAHRIAVAIEDAGFIIHPSIYWTYSTGFPKATRVDFPDDLQAFVDDPFTGHRYGLQALCPAAEPIIVFQRPYEGRPVDDITGTGAGTLNIDGTRLPGSDGDGHWSGDDGTDATSRPGYHSGFTRGGHQSSVGRWPKNVVLTHDPGCGDECVEGCPVRGLDAQSGELTSGKMEGEYHGFGKHEIYGPAGKTPATCYADSGGASRFYFTADWSAEVEERLAGVEPLRYETKASRGERDAGLDNIECVIVKCTSWENEVHEVKLLVDTAQSPLRVIAGFTTPNSAATGWSMFLFGNGNTAPSLLECPFTIATVINSITGSQTLSWLAQLLTSGSIPVVNCERANGGSCAESAASISLSLPRTGISLPKAGLCTGAAALATLPSWLWTSATVSVESNWRGHSPHPTHKPINLNRYLATLLIPPAVYVPRRLLVPFAGVASEMIGALLAGWEVIQGVELAPEYVALGEARLRFWSGHWVTPDKKVRPPKPKKPKPDKNAPLPGQLSLFGGEVK